MKRTGFKLVPKVPGKASKRPKVKRKKLKPVSRLKRDLDQIFSQYIRAKYQKYCYTCGKTGTLQNGHFISRLYLATRWEEDNCRPQCVGCNIFGNGQLLDFEEHLIQDLGADRVSELKQARKEIIKMTRADYEQKINHFKELLISLETNEKQP